MSFWFGGDDQIGNRSPISRAIVAARYRQRCPVGTVKLTFAVQRAHLATPCGKVIDYLRQPRAPLMRLTLPVAPPSRKGVMLNIILQTR